MNLKKSKSSKKAQLLRDCLKTKQFVKDWANLTASGRYNLNNLKEVMLLLIANDQLLGAEWLDHALKGEWEDHRECHVGGDFLLIYRIEQSGKHETVVFVRAGSHADLFE